MNDKQQLIDRQLVLDYQSGNKQALVTLVRRWHAVFCKKAFWILKDADVAKDIAQDSWSIIINKIDHLKNPNSFGFWASRIVYNKSLDVINADKRIRNTYDDYGYEHDYIENETGDFEKALKKRLYAAIRELPEHQQTVIRLFYIEDYSLKEISKLLNISIGTTKSRLFHAREKLKLIIKK
ncbi:RNA polymerase sigma factor [Changchengzhania lutea]|uniref:RNA polymerase sigma factor n=1 Tax=Changchengzhania lutea TaxID=2049305 RepID=UPI00115D9F3B|nr:sigma-70 family RNA polymerase sigma factor [Changchengzhania lutea]